MKNSIITSNQPHPPYTIELSSNYFVRDYSVYIIELKYRTQTFFYIDNLSDINSLNNKYAFRSFGAHFEDIASAKNNELYQFILSQVKPLRSKEISKISDEEKALVEIFLCESIVKMHVYPLLKFNYNEITKKEHKENNAAVKLFETQLKRLFKRADKFVINTDYSETYVRYDEIKFPKVWEQIKTEFYI